MLHGLQLIGQSEVFQRLVQKANTLAQSDATILLTDETGTGKDVFLGSVRYQCRHANKPFVAVNCGALPDHLKMNCLVKLVEPLPVHRSREKE